MASRCGMSKAPSGVLREKTCESKLKKPGVKSQSRKYRIGTSSTTSSIIHWQSCGRHRRFSECRCWNSMLLGDIWYRYAYFSLEGQSVLKVFSFSYGDCNGTNFFPIMLMIWLNVSQTARGGSRAQGLDAQAMELPNASFIAFCRPLRRHLSHEQWQRCNQRSKREMSIAEIWWKWPLVKSCWQNYAYLPISVLLHNPYPARVPRTFTSILPQSHHYSFP